MTSTSVKDVGSVLNTIGVTAGNGVKTVGSGFQMFFNGQTGKRPANSGQENVQVRAKKVPGDSLKAKDDHLARVSGKKSGTASKDAAEGNEELTDEKLEEILGALGTAAMDVMQQIADSFGVSPEEIAGAMEELGMEGLDVLDKEQLGTLLLRLSGAEDPYALVTDDELYGSYQEIMAKLQDVMADAGEQLELSQEQLEEALRQMKEPEISVTRPEEGTVPAERTAQAQDAEQTKPDGIEENIDSIGQTAEQSEEASEASREDMQQRGNGNREHSQRREHPGLFTQTFRTENFQNQFRADLQQTQAASESFRTDTQDIMRQIMDYMRIQVKADTSSLEMQLHPESLGTLHIQVASKGGVLTANFITQNEAVKAALESQMVQLRESFEQQGVKVEAIEVTVQAHAFERNLEQGRGQDSEQGQPEKRTRTRRINLNDSPQTEDLEQEDALAAEMMAVNGNQVDYTV